MRLHALALIVAALFPSSLAARQWTDITGDHHREAEYLFEADGQVWLQEAAGKKYTIRMDQLSAADRDYVASLARETTSARPQLAISTLTYRKPAAQAVAPVPVASAAEASLVRLTGWHCYSGHCSPTIDCCPTPCPAPCPHPCPPPPDKGKRIMKGWRSTFHLVARVKDQIGGTGTYKFIQRDGCCHQYLELLKFKMHTTNNDWVYEVVDSTPGLNVMQWKFTPVPGFQEWYWVYYKSTVSPAWVYYDIAGGKVVE